MSFLYPGVLAALAVVGYVVILHMIRRPDLPRIPFGSVMFLRPTAARSSGRRRLKDLLLMILRIAALGLLVTGFARPFVRSRQQDPLSQQGPGRSLVILLDTSASMRARGLWDQAMGHARSIIPSCEPHDRLCLMTFDQTPRTILDLRQWAQMSPQQAKDMAIQLLSTCRPGWSQTRPDLALQAALDQIEADVADDPSLADMVNQVILISDMRCPAEAAEAIGGLDWPKKVMLRPIALHPNGPTNATLELADQAPGLWVKVSNWSTSKNDRFRLRWPDLPDIEPLEVYVQPGGKTVLKVATGPMSGRLVLEGDDHDFDNSVFVAPRQDRSAIVYVGNPDRLDPQQPPFYLSKAIEPSGRQVTFTADLSSLPAEALRHALLVIVGPGGYKDPGRLSGFVRQGGVVLIIAADTQAARFIMDLADLQELPCQQVQMDQTYAMILKVDAGHSILSALAQPRYNNFTQIHIWRYFRFDISHIQDCRPLMWLDTNDPGLFELACGKGKVLVLAHRWNMPDSDLALSSKFVPLLYGLIEYADSIQDPPAQYYVGQRLPAELGPAIVTCPDGSEVQLAAGQAFTQTTMPGLYTIRSVGASRTVAVNIWPTEGLDLPLVADQVDALNMATSSSQEPIFKTTSTTGIADTHQLEARQGLWRWLLAACMLVLFAEAIWSSKGEGKERSS
ncbi:MAG: VWA domain-containing protein [Sedimentisphaerales bacterium]|nr:VWA domain-containing protein [Sedimentisphaerales bacterium]